MPVVEPRSVLSGIPVREAMRRQIVSLPCKATIGQGIRLLIRHKAHAMLLIDADIPCGVVSKTDLLGAFYAQLPTDTPLGEVMGSQPITCFPDDPLEKALETMDAAGVHRLYVAGANHTQVIGALSYADIVGLLYRYCRSCEHSQVQKRAPGSANRPDARLSVKDVMSPNVVACRSHDRLFAVIETLTTRQKGAVLIQAEAESAVGVISKTDLIIAYRRGVAPDTDARQIMNAPVHSVAADVLLSTALQQMLVKDVQRLFVHRDPAHPTLITGVLALSDAARFRSGSCRACTAGRMLIR